MSLLHGVALVGHADFREPPLARELEGVTDDPVHALESVQLLLDRDFIVGPGFEAAADAYVEAFRVLSKDDEVHIVWSSSLERTQALVEQRHGPVVDVQIE